ncbi:ATP-binding cassette domain-containing protein [Streptomyces coeruleoprunus]|uniref:ATP-binding cassette domain-containing protein n=1 Tax=Streptomyces coeruleoprunus TaxID=285563 RepID=A0ABV9XK93_9ACTN
MTRIDIQRLVKEYGRGHRALDGPTFSVLPGRVTGFLGPNGAGKSTTLRLLLGLDRPTSGTALVDGRPYRDLERPLCRVGALLDPQAAHGSRTGRDHLRILAATHRIPARRVDQVLAEAGLGAVSGRRVKTYSLGMRQRLGIAAALLGDPEVVLLDEPSNGLDPEGIIWIRQTVRRLAREGRTVLVSSHLMSETATFADHLIVLGRGRLLADTPVQDLLDSRGGSRAVVRTGDDEGFLNVLRAAGHRPVRDEEGRWSVDGTNAEDIGALLARAGVPVLELTERRASLEEAYLALTAGDTPYAAAGERQAAEAATPARDAAGTEGKTHR